MVGEDTIVEMMETALRRFSFMECLNDEPTDKRTLVSKLDCSRSTVNRGIRELESMSLVEYVDGGYRLSSLGELVANDFADIAGRVELRLHFEPFLKWIPENSFDLDLKHLEDAKLLLPEQGDPYAMVNRHVSVLRKADRIRCVLPLVGLHAYEAIHKQVTENGARLESVVAPEAAETLRSNREYGELTEDMAGTGRYKLYRFDGDLPYFVGLIDDTVQIGVDEEGEPRALVETSDMEVQDWAAATFEEYKQQAEPVIAPRERTKLRT